MRVTNYELLLSIEMFDHIIVGADTTYCSLREQGNL